MKKRKLVLENGFEFIGEGIGFEGEVLSEIVFNTSMVGYQEIISDPSYAKQAIVMTYPLIGNYGFTMEDYESKKCSLSALIVKEANHKPSNYRYTQTLDEVLKEQQVVGITGVDTRKLVRVIRDFGSMKCLITSVETTVSEAKRKLLSYKLPTQQVKSVTSKKIWHSKTKNYKHRVVFIDCGTKQNIINKLNQKGCNVVVVPFDTDYETIKSFKPDGVFISNGPGNPEDLPEVIHTVKQLMGEIPMFGICLGHQLIALATGAHTYKLKFGHRGGNHPVKNLLTGKVEITSQNHSFAVVEDSIKDTQLKVTHRNILDNTIEGIKVLDKDVFSVQYHPESAPGPEDSEYLFDQFTELMEQGGSQNA